MNMMQLLLVQAVPVCELRLVLRRQGLILPASPNSSRREVTLLLHRVESMLLLGIGHCSPCLLANVVQEHDRSIVFLNCLNLLPLPPHLSILYRGTKETDL